MPIHLRAEAGDYAPNVLCPGDPLRAKYIAETFFDPGFRQVNAERGMLGFTGTFEGQPISVQSTGMGCPSAGDRVRGTRHARCEASLAGRHLRRPAARRGDGRHRDRDRRVADDRSPLRYAQMDGFAPSGTFILAETAATSSRESGSGTVHVGSVVTSGVFYDPDDGAFARWRRLGHLGVEMEAAMLYTIAAVKGIESLAIMTVSDLLGDPAGAVRISDENLKAGVDQMMRIACRVAVS